MNRASPPTGWVRNPVMKSPELDPRLASSYEFGCTWNPITGCLNHINGMCKGGGFPCYAYRLANGRLKDRYLANTDVSTVIKEGDNAWYWQSQNPFYPRFWPERLNQPRQRGGGMFGQAIIPRGIFVCDMGELFGDWLPVEWIHSVMGIIVSCPQHRFYLLTKQPQNLVKFSPFPENCWVGVTVTDGIFYREAIGELHSIQAKVKYISFEPLLQPIGATDLSIGVLDWLIIGAQTKPYRPPKIEWVQGIVEAADRAGVKVFLKDNLRPFLVDALAKHQIDRERFFVGSNLRQEMPEGGKCLTKDMMRAADLSIG